MKNIICTVLAGALACQQASAFVSTSAASSKSNENNKQMMSTSSSSALSSMSYNQNFYNNGNRMIGTSSSSALSMSYNQNFYNNGNRMIGNMNNYGAYQNYNMGMMGGGSYIYDPAMTNEQQDEYGNVMDQNQYNRPRPGLMDPYRGGSTMGSSGKGVWVGPSYDEMSMRNRAGYGMMNQGPYSYNQGMMNPYYGGGYGYGQGGMMNQGMYGGGYYGNQGMYPGGYYNNRMLPPGRY